MVIATKMSICLCVCVIMFFLWIASQSEVTMGWFYARYMAHQPRGTLIYGALRKSARTKQHDTISYVCHVITIMIRFPLELC